MTRVLSTLILTLAACSAPRETPPSAPRPAPLRPLPALRQLAHPVPTAQAATPPGVFGFVPDHASAYPDAGVVPVDAMATDAPTLPLPPDAPAR